jgi:hypothetical protein
MDELSQSSEGQYRPGGLLAGGSCDPIAAVDDMPGDCVDGCAGAPPLTRGGSFFGPRALSAALNLLATALLGLPLPGGIDPVAIPFINFCCWRLTVGISASVLQLVHQS